MRFSKKQLAATAAASALLVAGGGLALAYWTSTGTGQGSASVGTSSNFTVTEGDIAGGPLTPGGPTELIPFTVTNTDTGYQELHTVTIQVAASTGSNPTASPTPYSYPATANSNPACTAADFNIGLAGAGAVYTATINQEIPGTTAGDNTYTGSVSIAMVDRHDGTAGDNTGNQDNCEGQYPPLFFYAS
jgi:hypothetical protein